MGQSQDKPRLMESEALFSQAAKAYRQDDFDAALQSCETLLAQKPAAAVLPAVLNLKALSLAGKGLMFSAADCLGRAVEMKPTDAVLHHHAARVLLALGRLREAYQEAERACELAPENTGYRYQLAVVCLRAGESEKAADFAQQCVNQDATVFDAWILLSELVANRGDLEQAAACLREIVRQAPGNERAWAMLAEMPCDEVTGVSIERALEKIRTSASDDATTASATFALADRARRRGDYTAAFTLYQQANERLAAVRPFDMERWEKSVEGTLSASRNWLESGHVHTASESTNTGKNLLFIVGMPRSGTSLCEQILCSHPEVMGGGEMATMEYIANQLTFEGIDPFGSESEPDWLPRMQDAYLEALPPGAAGYALVSDKTPRNFERLGLVLRMFPAARVLWCLRHPLDTILSCYFQDFQPGQRFSNRLDSAARMYADHVRLMRHWLQYFPASIKVIDYAELVQNLEAKVRDMAVFLDLDFDAAMLQPHLNPRPVRTASSYQVRQPVYTSSLDNWRHYRQELAAVCEMLQQHGLLDDEWHSTVLA